MIMIMIRRLVVAVHPDKNSHDQAGEACAKLQQVAVIIFDIVHICS